MLCLPGPENPYRYDGDFRVSGLPILIKQEGGAGRGTAWCVWDGAVVLARYVDICGEAVMSRTHGEGDLPVNQARPCFCIELGSGTGLAGLSAAQRFQVPVALTDLPDALPALQANVNLNPSLKRLAIPLALDWNAPDLSSISCALYTAAGTQAKANSGTLTMNAGQATPEYLQTYADHQHAQSFQAPSELKPCLDSRSVRQHGECVSADTCHVLVLASDCVWVQALVEPFVTTLQQVCCLFTGAVALLAHKSRSKYVDKFLFDKLNQIFLVEHMPVMRGEWRGSTQMLKLTVITSAQ